MRETRWRRPMAPSSTGSTRTEAVAAASDGGTRYSGPWGPPGGAAKADDASMDPALDGLEELERDECLRLLATAEIGRVIISTGALPAALPVNFFLDGDAIIFRTAPGTKLSAACDHAVVAFEVDSIDPV